MFTLDEKSLRENIQICVDKAKQANPLVPSITNTVTVNFVANAQLAVGGSAAMIYLPDEAENIARICSSFYINMGTLLPVYAETLPRVIRVLKECHKSWVLDPVGIGMGALREQLMLAMKECPPTIVRGNASEIIALANIWGIDSGDQHSGVRGVDSTDSVASARSSAVAIARFIKGAVAVSGEEDLITDGENVVISQGGSAMCCKVTGCGCSLGGVTAVYAGLADPLIAGVAASAIYNEASSYAEKNCRGTGSFQVEFLDRLYNLKGTEVAKNSLRIERA